MAWAATSTICAAAGERQELRQACAIRPSGGLAEEPEGEKRRDAEPSEDIAEVVKVVIRSHSD